MIVVLGCVFAAPLAGCRIGKRPTMILSIAASLQDAMEEVETSYQRDHGPIDFQNNFGSSGALAREIEYGAPVDAILSAGTKPLDDLEAHDLIERGTRTNLLRNSLVLIAPRDSSLTGFEELASDRVRVIGLGDPATVPAGQYGKQTLVKMQIYDKVSPKIVLAKDVRQVLAYVESGNADAGLVYATDARTSDKVRVVTVVPESAHDPIVYPLAIVAGSKNGPDVRAFVAYLNSRAAKAIFARHGFIAD